MNPSHLVRAAVTVSLLAGLASCSGDAHEPRPAPSDLAPPPIKRADKDRAAVERTLLLYDRLVKAALSQRTDPIPARRIRAVVSEPYATKLGRQLAGEQSAGLVMRGRDVYTTRRVTVTADRATLVTCWDPTRADIVNVHVKPERKVRPARANLTTFRLERSGERWTITGRTAGRPC